MNPGATRAPSVGRALLLSLACSLACSLLAAAPVGAQQCRPLGLGRDSLDALKAAKYAIADDVRRNAFALALADCLGDADPTLRDGIAFEGLQALMRGKHLTRETVAALRDRLVPRLTAPEGPGFARPFAALVLADVARTDRVEPWMTPTERAALVQAAAAYVEGVRDYRGYDAREGWRHGVAHGADLLMQLAYNPQLERAELDRILAAVASQVTPRGHFYTYGEPERLAAPVMAVARRNALTQAEWDTYFERIMAPAPLASWGEAYASQEGLAKRHNTLAFLSFIYLNARISGAEALAPLLPGVEKGIRALP